MEHKPTGPFTVTWNGVQFKATGLDMSIGKATAWSKGDLIRVLSPPRRYVVYDVTQGGFPLTTEGWMPYVCNLIRHVIMRNDYKIVTFDSSPF